MWVQLSDGSKMTVWRFDGDGVSKGKARYSGHVRSAPLGKSPARAEVSKPKAKKKKRKRESEQEEAMHAKASAKAAAAAAAAAAKAKARAEAKKKEAETGDNKKKDGKEIGEAGSADSRLHLPNTVRNLTTGAACSTKAS